MLLAYYQNGKLTFPGKVGTGFSDKLLKDLYAKIQPLKVPASPIKNQISVNTKPIDITWLKPTLVAEIKFMNGRLMEK